MARLIGDEAERIVFINCAMERGSQDVLHFAALRDLEATLSGPMVINHRADLDLAEAGWGQESLVLRNARELEMLILLSMADWLQQVTDRLPAPALRPVLSVSFSWQAEDVDKNGFGSEDHTKQPYSMHGAVPGYWPWVQGGIRTFRYPGYQAMLDLLDVLLGSEGERGAIARAVRVSFELVYERMGSGGLESEWEPDGAQDGQAAAKL